MLRPSNPDAVWKPAEKTAAMKYFARKAIVLILTVFFITLITFWVFHILPGDTASLILGTDASKEQLDALRAQLGTDQPMHIQYKNWMSGLLHGELGTSLKYGKSVAFLIGQRLPVTLILGGMVFVIAVFLGILLGALAAGKEGSGLDRAINAFSILGLSVPGFFLSILLMWIFGLVLHFFAPGNYVPPESSLSAFFGYMIWPALAIALPQSASLMKYVRTAVIEEMDSDYVRTAKGKGAGSGRILFRHILKNAIVAIVPLIGMMVAEIFSGSMIVEQVFGVPGIGRLLISSVTSRDFPLVQTLVVYIALIVVITNFLVDLIIQWIDPRIKMR